MKKLTSLLLALVMLFTALTLLGCMEQYALEAGEFGYDYFFPIDGIKLGIRSKENTFSRDNVNLDIYLGLKRVQPPIQRFFTNLRTDSSAKPIINEEDLNRYYLVGVWTFSDYLSEFDSDLFFSKENFNILKEVSHVDMMMSEEYDYYMSFGDLHYNYYENFTIPKSIIEKELNKDDGEYKGIAIAIFDIHKNENGEYEDIGYARNIIEIWITENEDGTVTIWGM